MESNYKQLKQILDNAPEESTHVEDPCVMDKNLKNLRYFLKDDFQWWGVSNVATVRLHEMPCFTRRLSDIKEIVDLMETVKQLEESYLDFMESSGGWC